MKKGYKKNYKSNIKQTKTKKNRIQMKAEKIDNHPTFYPFKLQKFQNSIPKSKLQGFKEITGNYNLN